MQLPDSSPFCVSLVSHLGLIAGPSSAPPRLPPCLEVFLAFFCILPAVTTAQQGLTTGFPGLAELLGTGSHSFSTNLGL